ncbi:MAG: ATP-binding protein [Thermodesulfobacteriota bacterium]
MRLERAIPVGFILTELVTTCLKHAFPGRSAGKISVIVRSADDKNLELIVADNRVGLPERLDPRNPKSLGLDLVNTLVEQLKGVKEVISEQGTRVCIRFPRD